MLGGVGAMLLAVLALVLCASARLATSPIAPAAVPTTVSPTLCLLLLLLLLLLLFHPKSTFLIFVMGGVKALTLTYSVTTL